MFWSYLVTSPGLDLVSLALYGLKFVNNDDGYGDGLYFPLYAYILGLFIIIGKGNLIHMIKNQFLTTKFYVS
jgi:hypothetical protein